MTNVSAAGLTVCELACRPWILGRSRAMWANTRQQEPTPRRRAG
jgi:hypothetical protein